MAPLILNLNATWRCVQHHAPTALPLGKGTWVGPRSGVDVLEKRRISSTAVIQIPGRLVCSLVIILLTLSRTALINWNWRTLAQINISKYQQKFNIKSFIRHGRPVQKDVRLRRANNYGMSIVTYRRSLSSKYEPKSIVQVLDVPQTDVTCTYTGTFMANTRCAFLRRNAGTSAPDKHCALSVHWTDVKLIPS
jgi:hypothetical protein